MEMMRMIYGGDEALSRQYEATYQQLQDCVRQRNRLNSYQQLTRKQARDLGEIKAVIPVLAEKLGEIHLQMARLS